MFSSNQITCFLLTTPHTSLSLLTTNPDNPFTFTLAITLHTLHSSLLPPPLSLSPQVPSRNLHEILRLSQAPVVQPAPPLPQKPTVPQTTPIVFNPVPAHPLKAPPAAKLAAQLPLDKGTESFPDEKYMEVSHPAHVGPHTALCGATPVLWSK